MSRRLPLTIRSSRSQLKKLLKDYYSNISFEPAFSHRKIFLWCWFASAQARNFPTASPPALYLLGFFFFVSGCDSNKLTDLEQYVQEVRARPKGVIEPLLEPKLPQHFIYHAGDLRNPFTPTIVELPSDPVAEGENNNMSQTTVKPDRNRQREALEEYALDSLKMVGILKREEEIWAIIRTSDGILYRVKKGNYMGRHYGRITHIDEQRIELVELISDAQGGWLEHQTILALSE